MRASGSPSPVRRHRIRGQAGKNHRSRSCSARHAPACSAGAACGSMRMAAGVWRSICVSRRRRLFSICPSIISTASTLSRINLPQGERCAIIGHEARAPGGACGHKLSPESSDDGIACFEAPLRGAPQHEGGWGCRTLWFSSHRPSGARLVRDLASPSQPLKLF